MLTLAQFGTKFAVDEKTGCWLWVGARTPRRSGLWYGVFNHVYAHRIAYELHKGPIPKGLVIDHWCSIGLCVNPSHLQAVTQAENCHWTAMRGRSGPRRQPTHCPHGHPYAGDNLYLHKGVHRMCRTCVRENTRRWRVKQPVLPKKGNFNARKTHCKFGHEYTAANTAVLKTGERLCRTCHRERARVNRARQSLPRHEVN